jgi:hypothetical protein
LTQVLGDVCPIAPQKSPPGERPITEKVFLQEAVHENNPIPGAVIAIQSFGDFLGFNPPCHILVTDGCFYGNGMSRAL